MNQRSPPKPVVTCSTGFGGVPGGESGDAPPGVPLVDPAADAGFQGGDAAVGGAAQLGVVSSANQRWPIRKFVKTARRYRTIQIQAGRQTITAADPLPEDLQEALKAINRDN